MDSVKTITVHCKNTQQYHDFAVGSSLADIYRALQIDLPWPVVAALVNNKAERLDFCVYKPKDIEFVDVSNRAGMRCYVRTLSMILACAVSDVCKGCDVRIEHSVSNGYYCTIGGMEGGGDPRVVAKVKERMQELIDADMPIVCEERPLEEVKKLFGFRSDSMGALLDGLGTPYCRYYRIGEFVDYYTGVLMPSTGYVGLYDLVPYHGGMLLRVPDRHSPDRLAPMVKQDMMFDAFNEYVRCNELVGVSNVGEFNIACKQGRLFDMIKLYEVLQENNVARIAEQIVGREGGQPKFILISGPSSSGKTTFSKRLTIQLMARGLAPVTLSMDNYFVNRSETPVDENGDKDFEHIDALDLKLFNSQLQDLVQGKEIDLPSYSFETGQRYYRGNKMCLPDNGIVIIEGIHALNPTLIRDIPIAYVFKIYVSALTTINVDNHNRVTTTDTRLLRRIIRDYRYRNYSARETIARAPSVWRGEERWIFPYQENADVMFNSALLFELAVLKRHAEPILAEVPKNCEEYTEAHRLLKFLGYFHSIPEREIPPTSMLREFIGGSSFRY